MPYRAFESSEGGVIAIFGTGVFDENESATVTIAVNIDNESIFEQILTFERTNSIARVYESEKLTIVLEDYELELQVKDAFGAAFALDYFQIDKHLVERRAVHHFLT